MDVDILFRIAAIGILVTLISQLLTRAGREEIAMLATISGLVVVMIMVINMISELFNSLRAMFAL